jgi:hypothetical protein
MNKNLIIALVVLVLGAGAGFFGGIKYNQAKAAAAQTARRAGAAGGAGAGGRFRGGAGGGFTAEQIISKDSGSITLQVMGGGSKIILIPASSQILKSAQGTTADLTTGQQVVVNGTANSDGSLTAQMIQIRPQMASQPNQAGSASNSNTMPAAQ